MVFVQPIERLHQRGHVGKAILSAAPRSRLGVVNRRDQNTAPFADDLGPTAVIQCDTDHAAGHRFRKGQAVALAMAHDHMRVHQVVAVSERRQPGPDSIRPEDQLARVPPVLLTQRRDIPARRADGLHVQQIAGVRLVGGKAKERGQHRADRLAPLVHRDSTDNEVRHVQPKFGPKLNALVVRLAEEFVGVNAWPAQAHIHARLSVRSLPIRADRKRSIAGAHDLHPSRIDWHAVHRRDPDQPVAAPVNRSVAYRLDVWRILRNQHDIRLYGVDNGGHVLHPRAARKRCNPIGQRLAVLQWR